MLFRSEAADTDLEPGRFAHEDVDLVRLYLQHIGKRKLLKAADEQAIGLRIEQAQRRLASTLAGLPPALDRLLDMAAHARQDPTLLEEFVLMPSGVAPNRADVAGVFEACAVIGRRRKAIEATRRALTQKRLGQRAAEQLTRQLTRHQHVLESTLAGLPLRPAFLDDVVAALRAIDAEFVQVDTLPRAERLARTAAIETRAGTRSPAISIS